jgi:hypothetical protein
MQRFRGTAILVSGNDISDSFQLPRVTVNNPVPGFAAWPTVRAAAPQGGPSAAPGDSAFETLMMGLLATIGTSSVGRVLLGFISGSYPVLITRATSSDIQRIGQCNAETGRSSDTLSIEGFAVRGHVKIAFPDNWLDECRSGPATEPHQVLTHELSHACEMSTHGGAVNKRKITRKFGIYDNPRFSLARAFDEMTEFQAVLVTNMLISETSDNLRFHHDRHARLPKEIANSDAYFETFKEEITEVVDNNRPFALLLSALTSPKFNPLSVYFNK